MDEIQPPPFYTDEFRKDRFGQKVSDKTKGATANAASALCFAVVMFLMATTIARSALSMR